MELHKIWIGWVNYTFCTFCDFDHDGLQDGSDYNRQNP